jgi:hypothetical protein
LNGLGNVEKALSAILSKSVKIHITSNGEDIMCTGCKSFVLDEVTAVYLACIGKQAFIDCSWNMTEAVYDSLSVYCKDYKDKWPIYNASHETVYFSNERDLSSIPTDVISNLSYILENSVVHSDSNLDVPLNLKLKLRMLCTENFLLSIALAEQLNIGCFCIDSGTRDVINTLYPNLISLKPDSFQETIISNKNLDIIANLLWLNNHLSLSSMSFDCVKALIQKGDEEKLQLLAILVEDKDDDWSKECLSSLVIGCLNRLTTSQLVLKKTEVVERQLVEKILLVLLTELTKTKLISD